MWPHTKVYMVSHLLTHLMLSLWLTRFKGIRSDFEVCSSSIAVVHAPHREMRCVTVKTFSPDCKPGLMLLVHVCKALGEAKFDGLIVQRVHQTTTKLACHQRVWTFPADSESFVTLMFLAGEKKLKVNVVSHITYITKIFWHLPWVYRFVKSSFDPPLGCIIEIWNLQPRCWI